MCQNFEFQGENLGSEVKFVSNFVEVLIFQVKMCQFWFYRSKCVQILTKLAT